MHMDMTLRAFIVTLLAFILSGCATRTTVVRCDGHLEPINAPAPHASQSGVSIDADAVDLASRSRE